MPKARTYLMCPPTFFDVAYEINPWMDASAPVDRDLALAQWGGLLATYERLGHTVEVLPAQPGLPDMVFAANGATVVDGRVLGARFANRQRTGEARHHLTWHREHAARLGWSDVGPLGDSPGGLAEEIVASTAPQPVCNDHFLGRPQAGSPARGGDPWPVNEGEGDFAVLDDVVLAGWGFRTTLAAHAALGRALRRPVESLRLVDERYYHLDTALCVLDDTAGAGQIAWYPAAFDAESQARGRALFPDAVVADETDAEVLGLNGVSDGVHVVLPAGAEKLAAQLAERGYRVIEVDLSELRKGGGSVKCCTAELRSCRAEVSR